MSVSITIPSDYWQSLSITKQDLEYLNNYLFDKETPLNEKELVPILVEMRIKHERESLVKQRQGGCKVYLPQEKYKPGEKLTFPALDWNKGKVVEVRAGMNPAGGEFEVIKVDMENGVAREFAAGLSEHKLNHPEDVGVEEHALNLDNVLAEHSDSLMKKMKAALEKDSNLVRVAGMWFPRALLVDINVGHLNLAEAILDEAAGKPLSANMLLEQVGLPDKVNPKLLEFSLNRALQEDGRFDEVGPSGEVLWCLQRLEPQDVREIPIPIRYIPIDHDRSVLTNEMLALESRLDDELSPCELVTNNPNEVTLALTYPHWRAGTLPISSRMHSIFPTAYESPRVRFTIMDAETKEEIPAWVVRQHGYVAGVGGIYKKHDLMPGSLVTIQTGKEPGKAILRPRVRRPTRDWVRTVLVGRDGGIVFAMLKQNISTDFDERMVIHVPDVESVDNAWTLLSKEHPPFPEILANMMRELTKLNLQGHVHAQELYSAINIIRRCPPGPILALLGSSKEYIHVGDLHFRMEGL